MHDPVASVLVMLALMISLAKLGGHLALRLHQPAVLGELLVGVVLGNFPGLSTWALQGLAQDPAIEMLARLGVVLLLFGVGLESTIPDMLRVGWPSLRVALLGVLAPFALGWWISAWFFPASSMLLHAFVGASLTATSVGITARVLDALGASSRIETRIILGAAVIDDVLALGILSVVTGMASMGVHATFPWGNIAWLVAKALLFLVSALGLGTYLSLRMWRGAALLKGRSVFLALGLSFCFILSWLADLVGLSPIVGAFAAGLILHEGHDAVAQAKGEDTLAKTLSPLTEFLVPIFFVIVGMRTDLRALLHVDALVIALCLSVVTIVGKQACILGIWDKKIDRLVVSLGMIPRGEVGLIFAHVGTTLVVGGQPLVNASLFSALVLMVMITTLMTPPALAWRLKA